MKTYLFFSHVPMDFEGVCYLNNEQAEFWFIPNRVVHRIDGPAISCDDKSIGPPYLFFINGEPYSEKDYWQHPLVVKNTLNEILNGKV